MLLIKRLKYLIFASALSLTTCINAYGHESVKYDADSIADIFYTLNGDSKEPHKKINHTKGFCAIGAFTPAKDITKTLDIPLLSEKTLNAEVRYSLGGGSEKASDKSKVRGMAVKLEGKNESWELVMLNTEINFAKNPQEFGDFFAMRIPKNGKVDSNYIAKKTKDVASYRNFETYMKNIGITGSVANTMYHSIHTFFFQNTQKKLIPARIKFVPVDGVSYLTQSSLAKMSDNFLESDFKARSVKTPILYKMILVFANQGDITNDTTALWSGKHKELELGILSVQKYNGKQCNGDVFMPGILPSGVGEPKDPLFELRNEVYAITFARRQ